MCCHLPSMRNCSEDCVPASGMREVFFHSGGPSTPLCPSFFEPNVVPPRWFLVYTEPTHGFVTIADFPPFTQAENVSQENKNSVFYFAPGNFEFHASDLVANVVSLPPSLKPFVACISYQFRQVAIGPTTAHISEQFCTQLPRLRHHHLRIRSTLQTLDDVHKVLQ